MNKVKRVMAAALAVVLILSCGVTASAFSDVSDSKISEDAAVLQMLGVIGGYADGSFRPAGNLTRAEFCKMAVTMLGHEAGADLYTGITIFPDVRSSHWASSYINYAAKEAKNYFGICRRLFQAGKSGDLCRVGDHPHAHARL